MRVSVVATGIDAAVRSADLPLPRRSMAAPLQPQAVVETVEVATPAPAPAPAPQPVAARAAPVAATPSPTLFEGMDDERRLEPMDDDFADIHEALAEDDSDALPPPAYTPRREPEVEAIETFVAPRAPRAGTPSPEALARLQAAVSKAPGQQPRAPQAHTASEAERPRFGINSLINRMTGTGAEPHQPSRAQPQVTALRDEPEAQTDPEQERIEIPAFLRRQAN